MAGKRSAHERLPEVIAAAVRVFTRDGYRATRMSDVAAAAGLSEAALYRYVTSKEGLFVLAIRHALLLEELPEDGLPLRAESLTEVMHQTRDFVAEAVPFGTLAQALETDDPQDPRTELEAVLRELFALEGQTRQATDMIERSARELPELAELLDDGLARPVVGALARYLRNRADSGLLRRTPDADATARLVVEALTWFARHRYHDPQGSKLSDKLAEETAVDAMVHALLPAGRMTGLPTGVRAAQL
jgi:AcrR family transcriptional regulator